MFPMQSPPTLEGRGETTMATFDESIEVNVPVTEAYGLFRQFEQFPTFMEGVEQVRREGPDRLHWRANIAGRDEEWEARVTADEPDTRIAWERVSGARNAQIGRAARREGSGASGRE